MAGYEGKYEGSYGEDSEGRKENIDLDFLEFLNKTTGETHHLCSQLTEEEINKGLREYICSLQYKGEYRYFFRIESCNDRWFVLDMSNEQFSKIYAKQLGLDALNNLMQPQDRPPIDTDRMRKIMEAANSITDEEMEEVARAKAKRDSKDDEGFERTEKDLISEDDFKRMMEGSS